MRALLRHGIRLDQKGMSGGKHRAEGSVKAFLPF